MAKRIYIIGEFSPGWETHEATNRALAHSAALLGIEIQTAWLSSQGLDFNLLLSANAIWIAPGSPYKNLENTLEAIRIARERKIPTIGTCGGFQYMIVEYARNVLGIAEAQHMEHDADASLLFISKLACSLKGKTLPIQLAPGSQAQKIYAADRIEESYYCQFGINPDILDTLTASGDMVFSGSDPEGENRILERPDHPFFIGTLFVPQTRSTAEKPHPLVTALLNSPSHSSSSS